MRIHACDFGVCKGEGSAYKIMYFTDSYRESQHVWKRKVNKKYFW